MYITRFDTLNSYDFKIYEVNISNDKSYEIYRFNMSNKIIWSNVLNLPKYNVKKKSLNGIAN